MEYIKHIGLILILIKVSFEDLKTFEIPDDCHVAAIIWWCVFLLFERDIWTETLLDGLAGGILTAGGLLLVSLAADRILKRESLGGGDIKLFFVTGLYLGLAGNLLNLILSCVFGIAFGIARIWRMKSDEASPAIPFAPAIALATCVCLAAGERIINWYLSLF